MMQMTGVMFATNWNIGSSIVCFRVNSRDGMVQFKQSLQKCLCFQGRATGDTKEEEIKQRLKILFKLKMLQISAM